MAVVWLVLGVVLLLVELRHLAFYALFAAIGSFGAAGLALVAPSAIPLQVGLAVALAGAGVLAVRPAMRRAFPVHLPGPPARGVHGGLVGQEAITLDEVGSARRRGHVRLTGERWLAISGGDVTIPPDTLVIVTAIEGTTLVVWPLESGRQEVPPDGADGRAT